MIEKVISILTGKGCGTRGAVDNGKDRIAVAASVLLLEMAKADGDFTLSERDKIRAMLQDNLKLAADEIEGILSIAEGEAEEAVDIWAYTNLINMHYSGEEKLRLVEMIWDLAYEDGRLDHYEDYLMHKLANLLHIKHKDLIAAKLKSASSNRGEARG